MFEDEYLYLEEQLLGIDEDTVQESILKKNI